MGDSAATVTRFGECILRWFQAYFQKFGLIPFLPEAKANDSHFPYPNLFIQWAHTTDCSLQ